MKSKKTIVSLALIIAVLVLGIGYAALSQQLNVTGKATIKANDADFNVHYVTTGITPATNVTVASATNDTATMEVELSTAEGKRQAVQEFTIINESEALDASIGTFTITYGGEKVAASDYITVTASVDPTTISANDGTATLTVTATLKDGVVVPEDVTEVFNITYVATAVTPAS